MSRPIWDTQKSISYLQQNASGRKSTRDCATFVRKAIEAGGVRLHLHQSAKEYKASLALAGFLSLGSAGGQHLPGDVIIIDPSSRHEDGHMAMYDGANWISDFVQKNMLHIYPDQTPTQANE